MAGAQRLTGGRAGGRAVGRGGASRRLRRCLRAVQAQAAEWAQKRSWGGLGFEVLVLGWIGVRGFGVFSGSLGKITMQEAP